VPRRFDLLGLVRSILVKLAQHADFDAADDPDRSNHAFRHLHPRRMVEQGAPIGDAWSVLGLACSETSREVYAPEPNTPRIIRAEWTTESRNHALQASLMSARSNSHSRGGLHRDLRPATLLAHVRNGRSLDCRQRESKVSSWWCLRMLVGQFLSWAPLFRGHGGSLHPPVGRYI